MSVRNRLLCGAAFLAAGVAAGATQAAAQSAEQEVQLAQSILLEEITVTARRRDESLQDIPLAISAFSRDQLVAQGSNNLVDVARFTPGIEFNEQGVQEPGRYYTAVRFRGLSTDAKLPSQQVGSVFLDGIYMANGVSSIGTENIERIEIVKGPSSALFGRSTFAGAVNFITRRPGFEPMGRISAQLGTDGLYDIAASYEGAIIEDKLAGRVYVRGYGTDGQYQSASDGGALGKERTETIVGTLYATPTEGLEILARALYSEDSDGAAAAIFLGGPNSRGGLGPSYTNCFQQRPETVGVVTADFFCGTIPVLDADSIIDISSAIPNQAALDFFQNTEFAPDTFDGFVTPKPDGIPGIDGLGMRREQTRLALRIDYEFQGDGFFGGHTVTSITGYNDVGTNWIRDFDFTRFFGWYSMDLNRIEDFTQEVRIASPDDQAFTYLIGLNYLDATFTGAGSGGQTVAGNGGVPLFGRTPPIFFYDGTPVETAETKAIFGSLGYEFNEMFSVDFEWRYQIDEIGLDTPFGPNSITSFSGESKSFLPRVVAQFQPSDSTNLFAVYSEGNTPAQFNSQIAGRSQDILDQVEAIVGSASIDIDEQELKNYEIGWKQSLWDGRAQFSLAGYFMEWTGIVTRIPVVVTNPDGTLSSLNTAVNAGAADIWGIEFEGTMQVTDNLSVQASINWNDAEYTEFDCRSFVTSFTLPSERECSGNRPLQTAEWTGAFATTWEDMVNDTWGYFIRFDGSYTGERYTDVANFGVLDDFWLFNLRLGFEKEESNLRTEFFVTNLFDDDNYLSGQRWSDFSAPGFGFTANQGVVLTPPKKRQYGIKVIYEF